MRLSWLFAVGILSRTITAIASSRHVVHEERRDGNCWIRRSKLESETILPMRIGLKQQNLHRAEEFLMDVSHHESPNFGKHWSQQQIADTFAPSERTVQTVTSWLTSSGVPDASIQKSKGGNWLEFGITVRQAEQLLHTQYYVFENDGKLAPACDTYSVPESVKDHIDFITPTVHLDSTLTPRRKKRRSSEEHELIPRASPAQTYASLDSDVSNCNVSITPACLRALYSIPKNTLPAVDQVDNSLGIVEFYGNRLRPDDLNTFLTEYTLQADGTPIPNGTTPRFAPINGGIPPNNSLSGVGRESDIDFEIAMSLVYPQNVTLFQVGGGGDYESFLEAIDVTYCQGGQTNTDCGTWDGRPRGLTGLGPYVISISWGGFETMHTPAYITRQCNEYMKLGLNGVTVLVASGDYGVSYINKCANPSDPTNATLLTGSAIDKGLFVPGFPATCPWVTTVGATQMRSNASVYDTNPEVAWGVGPTNGNPSSGGGFSNIFQMPGYQARNVGNFFANYNPTWTDPTRYNSSGNARGYPDVSANGFNHVVVVEGKTTTISGTSLSTPTFSSIIVLINQERLAIGKRSVGFLNHILYGYSYVLKDIVGGNNPGCRTNGLVFILSLCALWHRQWLTDSTRFTAVEGWDPITGLGTPKMQSMMDLWVKQLP